LNSDETLDRFAQMATTSSQINPDLYAAYDVKRGLRDLNGKGVLAGLTNIGEVSATRMVDGQAVPAPGKLIYRGIDIEEIVGGFLAEGRFGFEETCYLLLFGQLPDREEMQAFKGLLAENQRLPDGFDDNADDTSVRNVLRQCIKLIASFPSLAVYGYQAFAHYHGNSSLIIHSPEPELSIAENILHMLRPDSAYTHLEAVLLDLALVLHAEHGGGNNSTFVAHVVSSTGTDTYSVMAAALGSLKGPKHGGANIKVMQMFADMKWELKDWTDENEISLYLLKLINKQAFDRSGLIYGLGHAVYSISDPRAVIFKEEVRKLAREKGLEREFALYERVERLAPQVIASQRKIYKGVSVNIDFYSGFVYSMLNIPMELFTPIFAISRVAGWSAHHIEEIVGGGKIIRPAYKSIAERKAYLPIGER
jgi:citrate synthase